MQILAFFRCYTAAMAVHDLTVPKPRGKRDLSIDNRVTKYHTKDVARKKKTLNLADQLLELASDLEEGDKVKVITLTVEIRNAYTGETEERDFTGILECTMGGYVNGNDFYTLDRGVKLTIAKEMHDQKLAIWPDCMFHALIPWVTRGNHQRNESWSTARVVSFEVVSEATVKGWGEGEDLWRVWPEFN